MSREDYTDADDIDRHFSPDELAAIDELLRVIG